MVVRIGAHKGDIAAQAGQLDACLQIGAFCRQNEVIAPVDHIRVLDGRFERVTTLLAHLKRRVVICDQVTPHALVAKHVLAFELLLAAQRKCVRTL